MRRKLLACTVGLSTVACLVVPSAAQAAPAEVAVAGLTDSAEIAGSPVASGTIRQADGSPVGKGTLVVLQAWPSSKTLAALKIGETVKTVPVGYAVTGADGSFAVRYSDRTTPAKYQEPDGTVSLELLSDGAGLPVAHSIVDVAPSAVTTVAAARTAVASNAGLSLRPIPGAKRATGRSVVEKACVTSKVATYSPVWTQVGAGYGTSGVSVAFTFKRSSNSTLGVGYSASGNNGSFSASGTSSFSSTSTTTFPGFSGIAGRIWSTQYQYGKYKYTCIPSGGQAYTYYNARVSSHTGGAQAAATNGAPTANYCTSYQAGSSFEKTTTKAYTFSGGAATSPALGINLSASTGYTSETSIKFTFSSTRKLCGTNAAPGGSPQRLVAKQ